MRFTLTARAIAFLSCTLAFTAPAQGPPAAPTTAAADAPAPAGSPPERQLADRLATVAEELATTRQSREQGQETLAPSLLAEVDRRLLLLERLEFLLSQQVLELRRLGEADEALQRVASDRLAASEAPPPAVVSIPELDDLIDRLNTQRARSRAAQRAAAAASTSVEQANATLSEAERKRSQARIALDESKEGAQAAATEARLVTARLAERVARTELELRKAEARSLEVEAEVRAAEESLLAETLETSRPRAVFTPAQLAERLADLDALDVRLAAEASEAKAAQAAAEAAWAQARVRLAKSGDADAGAVRHERVARLELEVLRRQERAASDSRGRIALRRVAWERRQAVLANGADSAERLAWQRETRSQIEELQGQEAVADSLLTDLRRRRADAQQEVALLESEGTTTRQGLASARSARALVDKKIALTEAERESIDLTRSVLEKLDRDLEAREKERSWVIDAGAKARAAIARAWDLEIGSLNERSVTLGGLLKGLLVLLVGLFVLRYVWAWAGGLLQRRLRLEAGAASTLESLGFYLTAVLLAVLALQVANVPLTAFTLLGGALAIGIGFGTQNLMNNFISGLLLLVERPVRVGDLIEVRGGTTGTIKRIGARSTGVLTGAGIDILVPNSYFLENEVVNWTLGDNRVRTNVTVGFAYGSPTREIAHMLKEAAVEHGRVLSTPEPFVLLSDFGDNALTFEVYFWVRVTGPMDARKVESALRFMIDSRARETGLVIAFPQRDVHLDATSPLDVRILRNSEGAAPEGEGNPGGPPSEPGP